MTWSLLDVRGRRKYLTHIERETFIAAAFAAEPIVGSFCLTLALTGARISEALALTIERIDIANEIVVFETLKRREKGIFRALPVPPELINRIQAAIKIQRKQCSLAPGTRIWNFSRPTAWKRVKVLMQISGVPSNVSTPRALRHSFGVEAVQQRIALSLIKKWLGHANIETTAIYADPVDEEERALARLMWQKLPRCKRKSVGWNQL